MRIGVVTVVGLLCSASLFAQAFNTTYYVPNGGYGGSSQTTRNGNSTRTTFYNQNGTYGGSAQSTTFGNQTTTQHYGANGMPAGRSVTTTFGNQTTTRHYNQYGMPAGSSTQHNNTFSQPSRANNQSWFEECSTGEISSVLHAHSRSSRRAARCRQIGIRDCMIERDLVSCSRKVVKE